MRQIIFLIVAACSSSNDIDYPIFIDGGQFNNDAKQTAIDGGSESRPIRNDAYFKESEADATEIQSYYATWGLLQGTCGIPSSQNLPIENNIIPGSTCSEVEWQGNNLVNAGCSFSGNDLTCSFQLSLKFNQSRTMAFGTEDIICKQQFQREENVLNNQVSCFATYNLNLREN